MDPRTEVEVSRPFRFAVIAVFLLGIGLPWLDRFRPEEARWPLPEKRAPAPRPELAWDLAALSSYPRRMEAHFADTFGFRDRYLRAHSVVKLFGLGVSPTPRVVVGEDGWLFFTGGKTLEEARGRVPFDDAELDAWVASYRDRAAYLAQQGVHYLLVLVPNKEELYPELLPRPLRGDRPYEWICGADPFAETRRLDQLVARLRAETDVDVLDLRAALWEARRDEDPATPVYVRLGTHWNGPGQLAAARAIAARLAERVPGVAPLPPGDELVLVDEEGHGDTWGPSLYVDDLLPQRAVRYELPPGSGTVIAETGSDVGSEHSYTGPDPDRPRALLLHDSFGPQLFRLLPWSFSELHAHWREDFPLDLIDAVAPDVVIEEHVQRWLVTGEPRRLEPDGSPRSAFFLSPTALLRLELPAALDRLTPRGSPALEPRRRRGIDGVEVTASGADEGVALPAVDVPEGATAVLRVDYWSPKRTRLAVRTGEGAAPAQVHELPRGRGSLFVPVPPGPCRAVLCPDPGAALFLHAVELRCRPAS